MPITTSFIDPVTGRQINLDSLPVNGGLHQLVVAGAQDVAGAYSKGHYEAVAAGAADQVLGATGAIGDWLEGLICVVATAATSQVQIKDGAGGAITVLPNNVGGGVGTYPIPIGAKATGAGWKVTTAAGVSVIGFGTFT